MEEDRTALRRAVESLHGCRARFREAVPVLDSFQGQTAWQGVVHVFDLEGHPSASVCYAWSAPIEGSERRRYFAVLHAPPVASPTDAVRASVIQEYRG